MFPRSEKEFLKLTETGNLIPVYKEISASLETPLSAYLKIKEGPYSFLLESVDKGVQLSRYSFIGSDPYCIFKVKDGQVTVNEKNGQVKTYKTVDPLSDLQRLITQYSSPNIELPGFTGGAIGYLGYDMVRYFEKLSDKNKNEKDFPDCIFMIADTVLIYDHVRQVIQIVVNVKISDNPSQDYQRAIKRIERIEGQLKQEVSIQENKEDDQKLNDTHCNVSQEEYEEMVKKAKQYIVSGDVYQIVLSQRFTKKINVNPLILYQNLRSINPSPYMFYIEMDDIKLIGSSPEILVKAKNGGAEVRPIAGTRPRGKDQQQEVVLSEELLSDEKERAEHLMLVDLGRNDLGRICNYGSVNVDKFMEVEKYSHVMHLVSQVKGRLKEGISNTDVLQACFPAGTVSGAPKIRAMQIIDELEPASRGPYAGAVGYLSYNGEMDTCITIRTIVMKGKQAYIQAGAGIVADSDPYKEYMECHNKAQALLKAIEAAERGRNDDLGY